MVHLIHTASVKSFRNHLTVLVASDSTLFTSLHVGYFDYLKNLHAHFGRFINDLEADHSCLMYSVMVSRAVGGCTWRPNVFGCKVVSTFVHVFSRAQTAVHI